MQLSRRSIIAFFVFLFSITVLVLKLRHHHDPPIPIYGLEASGSSAVDSDILQRLELSPAFDYRRYCFTAKQHPATEKSSLVKIQSTLLDGKVETILDVDYNSEPNRRQMFEKCRSQTLIRVPEITRLEDVNTNSLLFGVSTTLSRLESSLPAFSRWLANTDAVLVALIHDKSDLDSCKGQVIEIESKARSLRINLTLIPYHSPRDGEALKNFALAKVLEKESRPDTKWIGIIDDDTFVISIPTLLKNLEQFDPDLPWYLGALTEGFKGVTKSGIVALGGAGIFISKPLLETVAENHEQCRSYAKRYGDWLWRDCILRTANVQWTRLRGLFQIDMRKDVSGFYESGLNPLLTLHHWKSWHYHPVPMAHLVTDVTGPDAFLQRYKFDGNVVLTNGYSIVEYPHGVPDLRFMEATMTEAEGINMVPGDTEFHHSLGLTRPPLKYGKDKISWVFEYAVKEEDGTVRQFYIRRSHGKDSVDSIIEIDWVGE